MAIFRLTLKTSGTCCLPILKEGHPAKQRKNTGSREGKA